VQAGDVSLRSLEIFAGAGPGPPVCVHLAVSENTALLFTPDDNQRPELSERRGCLGELLVRIWHRLLLQGFIVLPVLGPNRLATVLCCNHCMQPLPVLDT